MPDDQAWDWKSGQAGRPESDSVARESDGQILAQIRTTPGLTKRGKPFDHVVADRLARGKYRLELIASEVAGTARPVEVYRAIRAKDKILKPWSYGGTDNSYCPSHWADIAIGEGACGLSARNTVLR
jgi:hypothetical protein